MTIATPRCYKGPYQSSHGFAPVKLMQDEYRQAVISWLCFGVFLACLWVVFDTH